MHRFTHTHTHTHPQLNTLANQQINQIHLEGQKRIAFCVFGNFVFTKFEARLIDIYCFTLYFSCDFPRLECFYCLLDTATYICVYEKHCFCGNLDHQFCISIFITFSRRVYAKMAFVLITYTPGCTASFYASIHVYICIFLSSFAILSASLKLSILFAR